MNTEAQKRIRITSSGAGEVTIKGLSESEIRLIEGMICGSRWVSTSQESGRLISRNAWDPLPTATDDDMLPFWRTWSGRSIGQQITMLEHGEFSEHSSASFSIQHLCGYFYTPEKYRINAELLTSYGFQCLRSQRGEDGRFSEVWYLPGLYHAKGELFQQLEMQKLSKRGKQAADAAVSFLCRKVSFGTLDISVQRAAMQIPD